MSIKFAILGLLSWKPSTGYDLKKVFEESPTLYWSGNNNQIYKTLVQLLEEKLVTNEVRHQESSPSKKIYSITDLGLSELRKWVMSSPEGPEFRKVFLIQLAWADQLSDEELDGLLLQYENEVNMQLLIQKENKRRSLNTPNRTAREAYIWDMLSENMLASYQYELDWIFKVRKGLLEKNYK
jgi:DNA-binding PadR family transcriptional regulator